ncbi:hypothetical protein LRAMOSA10335 [Lichtheimia ramosa]|uniref:Uncharacterized protein n=1 Tax=Lichtheimia ramosa TaxID=688394 RepID=A0A077WNR1_9FUNG|nr:hypothetical protein LRAMOSA10335 [Lichtheimia ramosa]
MAPQGPAYEIRFCKDNVVQVFDLSAKHDHEKGLPFEYDEDDVLHGRLRYSKLAGNRPLSSATFDDNPHKVISTRRVRVPQDILLQMDGNRRSLITNGQACATTRSVSINSSIDDDDDQGRPLSLMASTICSTSDSNEHIGTTTIPSSHLPVSSSTPAMSTNSNNSSSSDDSSSMIKTALHENHSPNKDEAPPSPPVSLHQQEQHQSLVEQARAPLNNEHSHVSPLSAAHTTHNNMSTNSMFASRHSPSPSTIRMDHPPISTAKEQQQSQSIPLDIDDERPAGSACCCIIS